MNHLASYRLPELALLITFFFSSFAIQAQISVNTSSTPEELVNNLLLGEGITATNITFNGEPANQLNPQIGSFFADSSAFPIAQGIVMGTGEATGIAGLPESIFDNTLTNDPDLMAISGFNVNNCAILEFDFVATTDTFLIDYIFGSTEYPAFTCTVFNDAFGIFLSGPGIDGAFTNNAKNIALIPNSTTPVSINSVNGGTPTGAGTEENCLNANPNYVADSIYFFNNNPVLENSIAYPGHTHMFTAFSLVQPGETYHFKFAIGNSSDQALQSAVMMRVGSAGSGLMQNELEFEVNTQGIDVAPEGIYIAGTFNYFIPEPMEEIADDIYAFSAKVAPSVNVTYKFFNGTGPDAAEIVPEECSINGVMPDGNRHITMPATDFVAETVCFGTCEVCEGVLSTDEEINTELKVYPNPSPDGIFQIKSPVDGVARIQVFDMQGKMVIYTRTYLNSGTSFAIELPEAGLFKLRLFYEGYPEHVYTGTILTNMP
jgi:hypothetical protein